MSGIIGELSDRNFTKTIMSAVPVLIDFWGDNCTPCKMMESVLEGIKFKYKGRMTVAKANIKQCAKAAEQYRVMTLPTLILFKNGKPVEKVTGIVHETMLNRMISSNLN